MSTAQIIAGLRTSFHRGVTKPVSWRINQLKALKKFTQDNQEAIIDALHKDLHKPRFESVVTEISMALEDIELALHNVEDWVKPRPVKKPNLLLWAMDKMYLHPEPHGVVLLIAPWNYPVQLTLVPIVGALAAGNCILLKPSEVAPHTEQLFSELLPKYLDNECFAVVKGGPAETQELLTHKFDHIFYTGSTAVGKIVMAAAAKHLTPVTLELGGKSPCIVDKTADLKVASQRIAWGKLINSGQSCIAPDYLFVEKSVEKPFIEAYISTVNKMFGTDPKKSDSLARIINRRHFDRISKLIEHQDIAFGGETDASELYIAPTVLTNVKLEDPVMKEEIFGPVLPVLPYSDIQEVIDYVNENEKPLALYVFSGNDTLIEQVKNNTSSGAFTSNDTMAHAACNTLPFGGVGPSGIGAYHGPHSFNTFSHMKPVLHKNRGLEGLNDVRYAPYTSKKLASVMWFLSHPVTISPRITFFFKLSAFAITFYFLLKYFSH